MKKIPIVLVAGARPNFMKISPIKKAFTELGFDVYFCNTQQHESYMMNEIFCAEFNLGVPDFNGIEEVPGWMKIAVIVGDVNGSLHASRIAKEKGMRIAHIEAGLRSGDLEMPEERNRIEIDKIADLFFITEMSGYDNLIAEGKRHEQLYLMGNTMIDTLSRYFKKYILLTLHRPSNVDDHDRLSSILQMMNSIGIKVLFPVHPRVKINGENYENIHKCLPLPYPRFIEHLTEASLVVTDSGGIQEELAWMNRSCVTLRANTERPLTLSYGNQLVYDIDEAKEIIKKKLLIPYWDGKTSQRIAVKLLEELNDTKAI